MPRNRVNMGAPAKKGTAKRLFKDLFSLNGKKLLLVFICICVSAIAGITATVYLQRLIDEVITPGLSLGMDAVGGKLVSIIGTMACIYLLGVACTTLQARTMATVSQGTLKKFRDDMFVKMQTLPIKFFDTHAHGDIMSTYTNDTDAMRQMISQSLPNLMQSALTIINMVVMMLYYSIWLTLMAFAAVFLMAITAAKYAKSSSRFMRAQQTTLAKEEGFMEEMLQGQKVVQVFCHEEQAKRDFDAINEDLFEVSNNAQRTAGTIMPVTNNLGHIAYVVIAIVGGLLVVLNVPNFCLRGFEPITIGIIISFLTMTRQLSQTIGQISNQVASLTMGLAGVSRIYDLMDEEPEHDEGYVTLVDAEIDEQGNIHEADHHTGIWAWKHPHTADGSVTYTQLKGDVVLSNVDFGYVPDKLVLHDVSIYANPGQKIAFVGATGAGKTTITNLINRFYDIDDGKIRYDGININKIRKPDLRRSLGVVLQDVNLFTGTVMDNIRYGKLDATDEECIAAAKLANADGFIKHLPDGYNTMLTNNGSQLSQGQRQLISIARAAVADPPVMILDEATSSIDTRTEALVQEGMDNLMKGRTVFVIAHRLSTIRNSEAIMVLDHGHIIERGSHDDLIAMKGTYYQLYTGAFELE